MNMYQYFQLGGPIMYILLVFNIIGFTIMLSKAIIFFLQRNRIAITSENIVSSIDLNLDKLGHETVIEMAKQEISSLMQNLEKGINTVKIVATISPLLGLLGTVLGVLQAFQVISTTGMDKPENFASGISMALITTVGGLIVSIPHYIGHSYLLGALDRIEQKIEKNVLKHLMTKLR